MKALCILLFGAVAATVPPFFHGRPSGGMVDFGARMNHLRAHGVEVEKDMGEDPYPFLQRKNYSQKVTHFDASNQEVFAQRYNYNGMFSNNTDVVFLLIEGESPMSERWAGYEKYQWLQLAKLHGAHAYQLEHRCFGESRPYNDLETSTLKYCIIEEALEDIATFITAMNRENNYTNPKWITFGGSYPGILSALFRARHPELTVGAVASSAPLYFTFDMWEYALSVEETFNTIEGCSPVIRESFTAVQQATLTLSGRQQLNTQLHLQTPLTSHTKQIDIDNLFENLFAVFQEVVQYTGDGRDDSTKGLLGITEMCRLMKESNGSPIERLWEVINWVNGFHPPAPKTFLNSYDDMIATLRNTSFDEPDLNEATNRGWLWLQCHQIGVQQTTDQGKNIFGQTVPINYFLQLCKDGFGEDVMSAKMQIASTDKARKDFGNGNFKATNVILPNGSFDPWHKLGFYNRDETNRIIPIYIQGTAHCADMYEEYDGEPEGLLEARKEIFKYVKIFLQD